MRVTRGTRSHIHGTAEAMTGYALAELRGSPSTHLYVPEAEALFLERRRQVYSGAPVSPCLETVLLRNDGRPPSPNSCSPSRKGGSLCARPSLSRPFSLNPSPLLCGGPGFRGSFRLADALWPVDADTGQMSQVFQNVALNAVQAMPAGGSVEVQADNVVLGAGGASLPLPKGRYISITVQDHGCGIPREVLPKIL